MMSRYDANILTSGAISDDKVGIMMTQLTMIITQLFVNQYFIYIKHNRDSLWEFNSGYTIRTLYLSIIIFPYLLRMLWGKWAML